MTTASGRTLVFASLSASREISVLSFDGAAGTLKETGRYPIPGDAGQSAGSLPFVLSRDRRFLYAAPRTEPFQVFSFAVGSVDGALSFLGEAPVAERPAELLTDRSDRFLFTVSYSGSIVTVSPIASSGAVLPATQVIQAPPQTHGVVIDPTNRDIYVACMSGDILAYRFDIATGRVGEPRFARYRSADGAGPRRMAFGTDARHLYVITEHHGTVIAFARDPSSGVLTELQTVSMLPDQIMNPASTPVTRPPPGASDIRVTPDGRFVISTDRITNSMASFRTDPATGTLTPVGNYPAEPVPRSIIIGEDSRNVFCIGVGSGTLGVYGIDPETGTLGLRSSIKLGETVDWVEVATLG